MIPLTNYDFQGSVATWGRDEIYPDTYIHTPNEQGVESFCRSASWYTDIPASPNMEVFFIFKVTLKLFTTGPLGLVMLVGSHLNEMCIVGSYCHTMVMKNIYEHNSVNLIGVVSQNAVKVVCVSHHHHHHFKISYKYIYIYNIYILLKQQKRQPAQELKSHY